MLLHMYDLLQDLMFLVSSAQAWNYQAVEGNRPCSLRQLLEVNTLI